MRAKALLTDEGRAALHAFVSAGPTLLAFDYDGTLAPLVLDPAHATMRPRTRALLDRLVRARPDAVALVSGRARSEVLRLTQGVAVRRVVGSHGRESSDGDVRDARVERWGDDLSTALADVAGVRVERKPGGVALHWRGAPDLDAASEAATRAAEAIEGARVIKGHMVVEVLPSDAPHKGHAIESLCADGGFSRALYVGDDTTDESVFAHARVTLFGVRVGEVETAAEWGIACQRDVDAALECLAEILGA